MSTPVRFLVGLLGAIVGFALAFGLEIGLIGLIGELLNSRIYPKGLGWIVLPIMGGIAGWRIGKNIDAAGPVLTGVTHWFNTTQTGRFVIVAFATWFVIWTVYAYNSDSFYSYHGWDGDEWMHYFLGLVLVPLGGFILWAAIGWIRRGQR